MKIRLASILMLAAALLAGGCQSRSQTPAAAGPPVVPVSVAKATQESVPTELRVVGTVEASAIVQIKSQIAGQLLRVSFTEGQNVANGDLLFQIDPRPYEEALRQAEANVPRDRAQIAQSEATLARDHGPGQISPKRCRALRRTRQGRTGLALPIRPVRTGADVARESARATQATHRERQGRARQRSLRRRRRQAQPQLLPDPLAPLRAHRQPAGSRRQPGQGQRRCRSSSSIRSRRSSSTSTCPNSTSRPCAVSTPPRHAVRVFAQDDPTRVRRWASPSSTTPSIPPPAPFT